MSNYKLLIAKSAERDLLSILDYITENLKEPVTAKRIYQSIKDKIISLSEFPKRYPLVTEAPFRDIGIHHMTVENYSVFYLISDSDSAVEVIRVLYQRREWQSLLRIDDNK